MHGHSSSERSLRRNTDCDGSRIAFECITDQCTGTIYMLRNFWDRITNVWVKFLGLFKELNGFTYFIRIEVGLKIWRRQTSCQKVFSELFDDDVLKLRNVLEDQTLKSVTKPNF